MQDTGRIKGTPGTEILFYLEARERYPHVFPRSDPSAPLQVLTNPDDITACMVATGVEPVMIITSHTALILHPIRRADGSFGTHRQVVLTTELEQRVGVPLFPLWVDESGTKRTVLVVHYRVPIAHLPLEYGGGWALEFPAFAQRSGMTVEESIREETLAEANVRVIAPPRQLSPEPGWSPLDGVNSQIAGLWMVPVEPLPGEPLETLEGIAGRVFWTKEQFREGLLRGTVEIGGRTLFTGCASSFVTWTLADLLKIW